MNGTPIQTILRSRAVHALRAALQHALCCAASWQAGRVNGAPPIQQPPITNGYI